MKSPFDDLCALLYGLAGDLGATGALPEYKRNMIWEKLREIRAAHEEKSKPWKPLQDLPKMEMTVAYKVSDHYQQIWQQAAQTGQCKLLDEHGKEIGHLVDVRIVNGDSIVGVFVAPDASFVKGEQQLEPILITRNEVGNGQEENKTSEATNR